MFKGTLVAAWLLAGGAAAALPSDSEINARYEFQTLCRFDLVALPTSVPAMKACDDPKAPTEQISQEAAALWAYLQEHHQAEVEDLRKRFATFLQNSKHVNPPVDRARLSGLDALELCALFAAGGPNEPLARAEIERRRMFDVASWQLIDRGTVKLGISEAAVYCALGKPADENRSVGEWGVHKQLVYWNGVFVYLENGKVTSWQD